MSIIFINQCKILNYSLDNQKLDGSVFVKTMV